MNDIKILKIKREFKLFIQQHIKNNTFIEDKKWINFMINNFEHLNISISQNSVFGFTIKYRVWLNNRFIMEFEENELPILYNRKTMDKLIFSELNKKRYYKSNKNSLQTLSEISY